MKTLTIILVLMAMVEGSAPLTASADEVFDGQDRLVGLLNLSGGFGADYIFVWEGLGLHLFKMEQYMEEVGVPYQNIWGIRRHLHEGFDPRLLVVNVSTTWNLSPSPEDIVWMEDTYAVVVTSGGNVSQWGIDERDLYTPTNSAWSHPAYPARSYEDSMRLLETGKVIIALVAVRNVSDDGTVSYSMSPSTVQAGNAKHYCFSVPFSPDEPIHTSGATARLSALSFFFRQLWDTPEEVVDVLRQTSLDIGEPGVDEEFGWGVPTADHPIIHRQVMKRVVRSLLISSDADVLQEVVQEVIEEQGNANQPFVPSYSAGEDSRQLRFSYNYEKSNFSFGFGSATSPFGVSSSFLGSGWKPTVQFGVRRSLLDREAHTLSAFAQYGQSSGEDFILRNGRVGLNYRAQLGEVANLSLYAGYRQVSGRIGIPGYNVVGVAQTPFAKHLSEAYASFNWIF